MTGTYAQLDGRKRINLSSVATSTHYQLTVEPSGRIILEPARMMTEVEAAYLESPELRAAVADSKEHPEKSVPRPKRTR